MAVSGHKPWDLLIALIIFFVLLTVFPPVQSTLDTDSTSGTVLMVDEGWDEGMLG